MESRDNYEIENVERRKQAARELAEIDLKPMGLKVSDSHSSYGPDAVMVYTEPFRIKGRKTALATLAARGWRHYADYVYEGHTVRTVCKSFDV
jgi:hypothetical protein